MEITKSLQDDIVKIQHELITAIQNHQVLVLRQQVIPTESIKTQIEEVQRHIICLGESQKILVARLRNELEAQSLQLKKNKHKSSHLQRSISKSDSEHDRFNKLRTQELGRSLLVNNVNNRERSLLKPSYTSDSDSVSEQKNVLPKVRHISVDSSSEENRTPCCSPINGNGENEQRGVKRPLPEPPNQNLPGKRPKTTLQAAPRPSSPVPVRTKEQDGLSSFSEESLDSLLSQQPESETKKIDFALALGLVTKEVYGRVIKKKSERRRRKSSVQQNLCNNDQWDLTVLQKRSRLKEPGHEEDGEGEDGSRDCTTPQSDSDGLCFACLKPGELRECRVCHTGCHVTCVSNDICPACLQRAGLTPCNPLITEKKKELEQLRLVNKDLHKSVAKLRERANELSASLVMQTTTVNQMVAKEDQLLESITKLKDFVSFMQKSPEKVT